MDLQSYEQSAQLLADRIFDLIPEHPEIMTMESAWGLFKVPGFKCDDLQPSLAQAQYALTVARARYQHQKTT